MNRAIAPILALLSMFACGGTDFSTAEGAGGRKATGSGGAASRGGQSSEGGTTATTLPAVDCAALWKTYLSALEAARACDPGKGTEACSVEWVLAGPCGCDILVNGETELYATAKSQYEAFAAASCVIETCPTTDCPAGAGAETPPTCKSSGTGSASTCQW
jgi:hypothetical protein